MSENKLSISDFDISGQIIPEPPVDEDIEEVLEEEDTSQRETPEEEEEEIEVEDTPIDEEEEKEEPTVDETPEDDVDLDLTPLMELVNRDMPVELDIKNYDPTDVDSLASFIKEAVKQNSKPEFASDEVKQFNDFVKNGGDPRMYVERMYGQVDYESVNIEDNESAQKEVLRNFLTAEYPNKKADWIEAKIERYENSGVLEDEAKDALATLVEIQKSEKDNLAERQRLAYQEQQARYEQQLEELRESIYKKDEILGKKITSSEKKELFDFATKRDKHGKTDYEKMMESAPESALAVLMLAKNNFDIGAFTKAASNKTLSDVKKKLSRFSSTNVEGGKSSVRVPNSSKINLKEDFSVS